MRTITHWDPNHPKNMMNEHGNAAKKAARKLSNKELDELLTTNIPDLDDLNQILTWTRSQKIKFIVNCAKGNFVKEWNKYQAELTEKAKETASKESHDIYECNNCGIAFEEVGWEELPDFAPECPACGSTDTKKVAE